MSDESRADRLRRRRAKREKQTEASESGERVDASPENETDVAAESSGTDAVAVDETGDASERESVKATRVGTYMYLPEEQRSELNFRYKELNLAYERAVGDELEKNRHFYPLVVQAGLEALDGMDGESLRERVSRFE
ncbi:hypothetical protein [Haladaptatus sp. DYF46]|uniref:hypothetical protein n=1 Tax=Haladaptatus sp. DYF46 TaxID=2886041 RepID=UPI001E3B7E1E|nr:hypothetical protein [Haladaptatus sp. DYF46]